MEKEPKAIPVSGGRWALVDEEDYYRLKGYKWSAMRGGNTHYAVSRRSARRGIYGGVSNAEYVGYYQMHRVILSAPEGLEVDHINGDGLDNRRCNLRLATRDQNFANRRPNKNSLSGFVGVTKVGKGWITRLSLSGKRIKLGPFDTAEEAAKAYDKHAKELFGEYARLNFP